MLRSNHTPVWARAGLAFDPEPHEYRVGEDVLPSVTQILGSYCVKPAWFGNGNYAQAGTDRHRACEIVDLGGRTNDEGTCLVLDDPDGFPAQSIQLDPNTEGAVRAWRRFADDFGIEDWLAIEEPMAARCDGDWAYAGTVDRVAVNRQGEVLLLDIKGTWQAAYYPLQLAAYASAWEADPDLPRVDAWATVHLDAKAERYRVANHCVAREDKAEQIAAVWHSLLVAYRHREAFGLDGIGA